ncbi:hypothetical protein BOTBODRAFT_182310 [Botryobasidium botryosum FD-172 SS1]|uniref:BAH domain-containing protein n=1 Tax=Botryobasidium botryosum (strain FD-172 SS1) TaxID=930990 RepID=A0A067M1E0_BOTB1|nr:hypothetical protein BOTBODRAFT_182310 [Botryobasidium botryosum FD-172 SS1]
MSARPPRTLFKTMPRVGKVEVREVIDSDEEEPESLLPRDRQYTTGDIILVRCDAAQRRDGKSDLSKCWPALIRSIRYLKGAPTEPWALVRWFYKKDFFPTGKQAKSLGLDKNGISTIGRQELVLTKQRDFITILSIECHAKVAVMDMESTGFCLFSEDAYFLRKGLSIEVEGELTRDPPVIKSIVVEGYHRICTPSCAQGGFFRPDTDTIRWCDRCHVWQHKKCLRAPLGAWSPLYNQPYLEADAGIGQGKLFCALLQHPIERVPLGTAAAPTLEVFIKWVRAWYAAGVVPEDWQALVSEGMVAGGVNNEGAVALMRDVRTRKPKALYRCSQCAEELI